MTNDQLNSFFKDIHCGHTGCNALLGPDLKCRFEHPFENINFDRATPRITFGIEDNVESLLIYNAFLAVLQRELNRKKISVALVTEDSDWVSVVRSPNPWTIVDIEFNEPNSLQFSVPMYSEPIRLEVIRLIGHPLDLYELIYSHPNTRSAFTERVLGVESLIRNQFMKAIVDYASETMSDSMQRKLSAKSSIPIIGRFLK